MTTPRDHRFLFSIQLSLLLPFPQTHTQRNIKRLIHTNVLSAGSVRRRPAFAPEHQEVRNIGEEEKKRKSQSSLSKQAQVFSGINWRQRDAGAHNWNTYLFSVLNIGSRSIDNHTNTEQQNYTGSNNCTARQSLFKMSNILLVLVSNTKSSVYLDSLHLWVTAMTSGPFFQLTHTVQLCYKRKHHRSFCLLKVRIQLTPPPIINMC